MQADLSELVTISRTYGSDPEFVLAGGGNTSMKNADAIYVKASGHALGSIDSSGFMAIDRKKLDRIWSLSYPGRRREREKAVRDDLLALCGSGVPAPWEPARREKSGVLDNDAGAGPRPSVETLMHGVLPGRFVVHTHPCLVNGITCARRGRQVALRLLGDVACWVSLTDPGYMLARAVRDAVEAFTRERGRAPCAVLMQNHGLVVSGETTEEIKETTNEIVRRIKAALIRHPDLSLVDVDGDSVQSYERALRTFLPASCHIVFEANAEMARLSASRAAMRPVSSAFSPDQIVYAGDRPLFAESPGHAAGEWKKRHMREGAPPKIVVARGLGFFAWGVSEKEARNARVLFLDAVKVSVYTESFGGPLFLPSRTISFIKTWEAESYRRRVSGG
jgi:rhamnose utilization protein RhaD (predicted bifunctional aldolase and dehydrogenase)